MDALTRAVTGKKGSGKTYYVVARMLEALMDNAVVVSNIELIWSACEVYFRARKCRVPRENYRFLDTREIMADPGIIPRTLGGSRCLLALDEAHLIFDARRWKENEKNGATFQTFLTQGRKLSVDTYLIGQGANLIDSRLVTQATHELRLTNWKHVPFLGKILPLPVTLVRVIDTNKVVLLREWWWRPSEIGSCYNTNQTFLGMSLGGEDASPVVGRRRREKSYGFYLMLLGAGLLACIYTYRGLRKKKEEPAPPVPASPAPVVSSAPPPRSFGWDQLIRFEMSLPRLRRVLADEIILEDGRSLFRGSALGFGEITRWAVFVDHVKVFTNSSEIPIVRLYERTPLFCLDSGDSAGPSSLSNVLHGGVSAPPPPAGFVGGGVAGVHSPPPASFAPPEPFIPNMSPVRQLWFTSDRVGSPTPVHGFSDSPYR